MAFDKISLTFVMLLFLCAAISAEDVGIDFTLANAPPTAELTLAPLHPNPGTFAFNSNATYHDLEMETGTVNFTWYVDGNFSQPGGYYPAVASGGTVPAIPFAGTFSGGQTVMVCADVSDGINPPLSLCNSTSVASPSTPPGPSGGRIVITATGGACAYSPITLDFTRTGNAGSFNLVVRHPDGSTESIFIEALRDSYIYTPATSGSYYFDGSNSGGFDVVGATVNVGEIIPILHVPACSFNEDPQDHTLSPTGQPVSVYIVDNSGVAREGSINVTWTENGVAQSASGQGGSFSFTPTSRGAYHISVETPGCKAAAEFNPNSCLGNQTLNQTVQYTVGNKTFYIWQMPQYISAEGKGCNRYVCNMTADCCEGYCLNRVCVIPPAAPEQPWLTLKGGCYGLGQCTDPVVCWLICNFVWVLTLVVSAAAAYVRRAAREEAVMLFLLPVFIAVVLVPFAGALAAFIALGTAFYLKQRAQQRKKAA